jgi:hypothetical protein
MSDFIITEGKYTGDEYAVDIDCTAWLGTETISSVAYSAATSTGTDATATVLDVLKHTNTTTHVKPWIKAGTVGVKYIVKAVMTTSGAAKKTVTVTFVVK